jgi:prepilin-type N-terminal cleavage/methylation domain-containing protein
MNNRRAFTLIELLVVIAIIAILAAILFPVFAQAKMAAKKTVALSNAKQVGTAHLIYMGDFDDHPLKSFYGFPSDCVSWPSGNSYYGWRHALYPYFKNSEMLSDTTNPFAARNYWVDGWDRNNDGDTLDANERLSTNFAVNTNLIGFANGRCAGPWTPEGMNTFDGLDDIAQTIMIVPSRTQWNDMKMDFLSTIEDKPWWCINNTCPAGNAGPIHAVGKQTAFLWADSHAKHKSPLATLRVNDPMLDDWASRFALNPRTNALYTQADRIAINNTAWGEYR